MKNKKATDKIIELYSCANFEITVNTVAPPNQTANEVNQQQLVPKTKASILPKNDIL
jgi:hypothetical protein